MTVMRIHRESVATCPKCLESMDMLFGKDCYILDCQGCGYNLGSGTLATKEKHHAKEAIDQKTDS